MQAHVGGQRAVTIDELCDGLFVVGLAELSEKY